MAVLAPCGGTTVVWGLTFHKLPVVGLVVRFSLVSLLILLVLRLVVGVFLILGLRGVNRMLVLSSNNTFASFVILLSFSPLKGLLFFILYVVLLWVTFGYFSFRVISICLLLGFMGMPPLFLFQSKWVTMEFLWSVNTLYSFVLGVVSGVSSLVYIRFVYLIDCECSLTRGMAFYLV